MKKLILIAALVMTGCATQQIVDRDFDKEEIDYVKKHGVPAEKDPLWQAPSEPFGVLVNQDGIRVTAYRSADTNDGVNNLQVWNIDVQNTTSDAQCIALNWKLQDFQLESNYETFIYVQPKQLLEKVATLTQKVWQIADMKVVLPPSGYIDGVVIKDPTDKGDCDFAADTYIFETIELDAFEF